MADVDWEKLNEAERALYTDHSHLLSFGPDKDPKERVYWENVARIALRRFPELQDGERISPVEIKNRLKELRSAGYHVQSYSKMNLSQLWGLLKEIRQDVHEKAKVHAPAILREISSQNNQQKLERKLYR